MRSPARAIGWEIWARSRLGFMAVLIMVPAGGGLNWALGGSSRWADLGHSLAYTLSGLALLVTLGCFHFTEGSKKAGFGSFPMRLFILPMTTRSMVMFPMLYGAVAMVVVYLSCAVLLLRHLGPDLPLLWPCLYLVFGLTQFQMILWSLPQSRHLKLLCLAIMASIVTFGWMFFVPTIVAGALSEWGYAGDPRQFMRRLLVVLALTGPAAYGISLHRVYRQRHGLTARSRPWSGWWERSVGKMCRRRIPFRSADHAIFWQEWRRTGFILPILVVLIVGLTCVPAWLSGGLGDRATLGILQWLFIAPFLFAMIIGGGYGKPDFWSTHLKLATFNAIRPVTAGQWVAAKLKVGLGSALLTWVLVIYLVFLWTAFVGDLEGLIVWRSRFRFYYSSTERWMMLILALPAAVIITWRLLVARLTAGLYGSKLWYYLGNSFAGGVMVALFVLTLRQSDDADHALHLYHVWSAISALPAILTIAVVLKMLVAMLAWGDVLQRGMATPRSIAVYFAGWSIAVGILAVLCFILSRNTLWLRHLLMLASILIVPLARPALAMRSFSSNRSSP